MKPESASAVANGLDPIEIFRVGRHRPMDGQPVDITPDMIEAAAAQYDPAKHEAPVVIGHPKTDAPAYAWVSGLQVQGDGLFATLRDVDDQFAETVRAGRFKKISAAFWSPDAPDNPVSGVLSLRHVGFLGAAVPAVKGMKPVTFADGKTGILTFGDDGYSTVAAEYEARIRAIETRHQVEKLVAEGLLLPRHEAGMVAFLEKLDDGSVIRFSGGVGEETEGHRSWFLRFMAEQPKLVSYGKISIGDAPQGAADAKIAVPTGYSVADDPEGLLPRARAISAERRISFSEALKEVTGK